MLNMPISLNYDIRIIKGLFDEYADAMSSLQSALSRGFYMDSLRELARLCTEHGFITADEADCLMAEVSTYW